MCELASHVIYYKIWLRQILMFQKITYGSEAKKKKPMIVAKNKSNVIYYKNRQSRFL